MESAQFNKPPSPVPPASPPRNFDNSIYFCPQEVEVQPSPLALLAATCSKIGGVGVVEQNEEQNDGQAGANAVAQAIHQGSIRVVSAAMLQQLQDQSRQNAGQVCFSSSIIIFLSL